MKIKILDLLLDARHDVVMNAFEKFTFTLFLLLCGLLPSPVHAQESGFNSELFKNEIRNTFLFRPHGQVRAEAQKKLVLDLTYRQRLFLDLDFLKAVDLEQLKEIEAKTREMVGRAKDLGRERAQVKGKKKKQEFVKEWNEYLKEFDSEMNRLLRPKEKEILTDFAIASEFFELGIVEFLNKYSPTGGSAVDLDESLAELADQVVEIEKEVWELLLEPLDTDRRPEFELALNGGLPNRSPSLSVLWRSLWNLEHGVKVSSSDGGKQPVFAVHSGRLLPVRYRPYPATTDLMTIMQITSKGHSDEKLIRDCMQEMFTAHLAIQKKFSVKRSDARMGSPLDTKAWKKLNREMEEEQTESRNRFLDELPERARSRIAQAQIVSDYQRHGIERAWFSPDNRELMEVPPSEDDLANLKNNAKEARELLEERVHQLVKKFVLTHLSSHFEPNSIKIRWVYRKYLLQIPPIELFGIERPKGDFR